jgi:hypothetical protein
MGRSGERESDAERLSVVYCENDEWYSVTCRKQKRSPVVGKERKFFTRRVLSTCKDVGGMGKDSHVGSRSTGKTVKRTLECGFDKYRTISFLTEEKPVKFFCPIRSDVVEFAMILVEVVVA